jgi:hypothetical protein
MPVEIDIVDFKCFNQLRNGADFSLNASDFTPNLVGNIGEKVKVTFSAYMTQNSFAEGVESWFIQNSINEINRSSGSFLADGLQVGDLFSFYPVWATRKTIGGPEYTGVVTFISSDGQTINYTVSFGSDSSNGEILGAGITLNPLSTENRNAAAFLRFGLLGEGESFNYLSKTTESLQVYYKGGIVAGAGPAAMVALGTIKDWVSGSATVDFLATVPTFSSAEYVVTHEFIINPFYILSYRSFIDAGTIPDLLAGDASLKYAFELEFRKSLSDTGSAKIESFDKLGGFVGWYGENFNGLNNDYSISAVTYRDEITRDLIPAINLNRETEIGIIIEKSTGPITGYSCAVYLLRLPKSESEYIGTTTDLPENFLRKAEIIASPATSTANVVTTALTGDLNIIWDLEFTLAEKLRLTTEDEYFLLVQLEDPATSAGDSDRVMLIADLKNFIEVDFLADFVNVPTYNFLTHTENLATNPGGATGILSNEDGILLNALIGVDTTKNVIINGLTAKLLAYDPTTGASFDLDEYSFSLGETLISGGVQQIEVETTRGYPLPAGDEFNLVRVTTETQVGNFQQFAIILGQKVKWQDWISNPGVDNVFFDPAEPNNNLNEKASNYSQLEGYEIRLALVVNVTGEDDLGRTITGDFINYGGLITVADYGVSDDGVSGVIQTFDLESGNSLEGGVLYNGKDTLFKAVFADAALMAYGIHRIEPSQNPGDGILELSSLYLPAASNILKPLSGETKLKFTTAGSVVTTECLIDGSAIQEGVSYKLSARIGVGPPLAPSGLVVVVDGFGLRATWVDNSTNETGFTVQRSTSADFTTDLQEFSVGANVTTYLDGTVAPGNTYYFRVKAVLGGLESDYSNTASEFYTTFEFTYDTANTSAGSTTNAELKLPLLGSGTYDFFIDWGDASPVENITAYNQTEVTHNFGGIATGTVRIVGTITGWAYLNTGDRLKILNLTNWGNLKQVQSGGQFLSCTNLNITATDIPDLSGVGNTMANFFAGCISLVFNSSVNSWDVSGCPDLNSFFNGCNLFNQDISGWDVSSNTNLNRMFQNCFVFNQPLDAWDVSNVTGFGETFANAKVFNQNLNSWNVSASSSFFRTFRGAAAFDGNISAWTLNPLGGVTMDSMFRCDLGLVGTFNQDITGWDMSKVDDIRLMLDNQDSFNQDISVWDVSNCNSIFRMFVGCAIFNQPIGAWNTSGFTSLDTALTSCPAFDQNLAAWDVTSVTNATSFLSGSTLSTANYDALLIGWEGQAVQNGVVFSGGNSTYTLGGAAETARAALIADHSWTITDGGGI